MAGEKFLKNASDTAAGWAGGHLLDALLAAATPTAPAVVAAAGISAAAPVAVTAGLAGLCAAALWFWSRTEVADDAEGKAEFDRTVARLLGGHDNLRTLLERVSARQLDLGVDVDKIAAAADQMLRLLRRGDEDRAAAEREHGEMLVYVARRMDETLAEASVERLALQGFADRRLREVQERIKGTINDDGQLTRNQLALESGALNRRHDETQVGIAALQAQVTQMVQLAGPRVDVEDRLAHAARALGEWDFGRARVILEELRDEHGDALSARQRFRTLANLAIVEQTVGDRAGAGRLFVAAADADPSHADAAAYRSVGLGMLGEGDRAWSLAQAAVAASPDNARAWSAWLHAAPDSTSLEEAEAEVPTSVRDDAEVLYNLGLRAQYAGRFDEAVRLHRACLDRHENELLPLARLNLAASLVKGEQHRFAPHDDLAPADAAGSARVREGADLLLEELAAGRPWIDAATEANLRVVLGVAHTMLGEHDSAEEQYVQAVGRAPDGAEVVVPYSGTLLDRGRVDEAVNRLRKVVGEGGADTATYMLASTLRRRGRTGDEAEALVLLQRAAADLSAADDLRLRLAVARELVEATERVEGIAAARAAVAGLTKGVAPAAYLKALEASVGRLTPPVVRADVITESVEPAADDAVPAADPLPPAARSLCEAAAAVPAEVEGADARRAVSLAVADLLQNLGQHDLAFAVYRGALAGDTRVGNDVRRMLWSAERAGEERFIVDFCRATRERGVYDRHLVLMEADLLLRYGAGERAGDAMLDYLDRVPDGADARDVRGKLAVLGILLGRPEWLEPDPSRLPTPAEAGPLVGRQLVDALQAAGSAEAAAWFAYELYRLNPQHHAAHEAVIRAGFPEVAELGTSVERKGAMTWCRALPAVTDSCSVRLRLEGRPGEAGREEWRVIEPAAGASPLPGELDPGDELALRLKGLRVGDGAVYRRGMFGDEHAEVTAVAAKPVGRAMLALEGFRKLFPSKASPAEQFTLPTDAAGELDARPALELFDAMARRDAERREEVSRHVREAGWPVSTLAVLLGATVPEAVMGLAEGEAEHLICCRGTREEGLRASRAFRDAAELVLDPTAASVLFLSDAWKFMDGPPRPLVVSDSTLGELRRLRSRLEGGQRAEAHVVWHAGRAVIVDNTDQDRARRRERIDALDGFLAWLGRHAAREDGLALLDVEPAKRHLLMRAFGRPTAEAVALARARPGRVLWCDDVALAEHAAAEHGVPSAWSELVLAAGIEVVGQPNVAQLQLTAWLCRTRSGCTRVTPPVLVREAERAAWDVADWRLRRLLDTMLDTGVTWDWYIRLSLGHLEAIFVAAPDRRRAHAVADAFLDRLSTRPWGGAIIVAVDQLAVTDLPDHPEVVLDLWLAVEAWLVRRSREIEFMRPPRPKAPGTSGTCGRARSGPGGRKAPRKGRRGKNE